MDKIIRKVLAAFMLTIIIGSGGTALAEVDASKINSVISPDNAADVTLLQLLEHGHVQQIAWSPDGKLLAIATYHIYLYDAETFEQIYVFESVQWANSIAFSPDGQLLASATHESVKLWDVPGGGERLTLAGSGDTKSVAFSPDDTVLATGTGKTVKLWDVESGSELHTIPAGDPVNTVAFSPDGAVLASGGLRDVKLWNAATGEELRSLTGHSNWIKSVTFSPDGQTLASGSVDNTVRLWDVAKGRQIRALTGHTDQVGGVAFSPDGQLLASASWDLTVKLWDVASGKELRSLTGHTEWGECVAFSPDGTLLASGAFDEAVRLWGATSDGGDPSPTGSSEVIQPTPTAPGRNPIQTPAATTSNIPTASVHLHGEKTDVVMGEDVLLKLSAVNIIGNPTMRVQVIIIPPSGWSVTSSEFAKSGAGQYTTTYDIKEGVGRDIEVRIMPNQIGDDFQVQGRIIYYFGDDPSKREDHTLTLPITVRAEAEPGAGAERAADTSGVEEKGSSTPGFAAVVAIIGLLLAYVRRRI
jgi:PGF-CTERM protein